MIPWDERPLGVLKLASLKQRWGNGYKKACQVHQTTSTQDRYLELSARRLRQITAPQLAHDFVTMPGRRISRQTSLQSSCRDCPLCPVSSLVHLFDYIQQERINIELLKTPVVGTFFSVMSQNEQSYSCQVFNWRENRARFHPS
ncbi:hypothetical protein TNCV_3956541 [Trichonephila clavipes]|nr:hypothetical protein TNCV_3956541 [Trichonephila clavipes]